MYRTPPNQTWRSSKNTKIFRVSKTKPYTSSEHFPKPYTKAELRMFKIDDSKLSETTDEDESSGSEEIVGSNIAEYGQ
jgi:hypothetical protein